MRKNLLLLGIFAGFAIATTFAYKKFLLKDPNIIYGREIDSKEMEEDEGELEGYDGAAARNQWEIDRIKDPATGDVPYERLIKAISYTEEAKRSLNFRVQAGSLWTERGPDYDLVGPSGNGRPGGGYTSGRMRAIWIDLADATKKTVWVGGICGGIWSTNDITASPATWTLANDQLQNMAVSSICQDPTNTNIMYLGTGEKTYNIDAVRGAGVWKSIDHGITWTQLSSTTGFYNISKIACDASGNVYVAGIGTVGLRRSTNGGTTWTTITPSALSSNVTDFDISTTGTLHVVCGYYNTTIAYRYTTTPATVTSATWTSPTTTFTGTSFYNCDIASSGATVYALPSDINDETPLIYKSIDGGANWTATATAPSGTGNNALSSGQGWYCLALAVDQSNANNVLVGGLNTYRSTDGGATWSQASVWVSGISVTVTNYVHADQQAAVWDGSRLLVASDGGLFYSSNNGSTFSDRNRGLRLKQFYSCAIHPSNTNYILAGAQDNGVHQLTNAGLSYSTEVTGGDGAFVDISSTNGNLQFGSYVYNIYRKSTNGGTSWSGITFSNSVGQFINPFDYDELSDAVYACYGNNTLIRWNTPGTTNVSVQFSVTGLGNTSAVTASPYTTGTIYAGSNSGKLFKITGANTATGAADATATSIGSLSFPGGTISCIALGSDENNITVVFSNYGVNNIWNTTDGGASWAQVDGNLPDMPVRWAIYPTGLNNRLIVATEAGVYTSGTINGGSTVWTPSAGFPTVRTDMLKIRSSDNTIVAATHGRGIWTSSVLKTLPLRNLSLKGSVESSGKSVLNWGSIDASPAVRYHLQFSKDGLAFSDIADIANTQTSFTHLMPTTQGYYRIIGVEPGAAPVISNIVFLRSSAAGKNLQVSVVPNPVQNNATLLLSSIESGSYQLEITTVAGQVMKRSSGTSQRNTTTSVSLNLADLPSGFYWIRAMQGKKTVTSSFIKN